MAFKHSAFIQSDLTVENDLNRNSRYYTRLQFCLSASHGAKRIMGKNKETGAHFCQAIQYSFLVSLTRHF